MRYIKYTLNVIPISLIYLYSHQVVWSPGLLSFVVLNPQSDNPRVIDYMNCVAAHLFSQGSTLFHTLSKSANVDGNEPLDRFNGASMPSSS